MNRPAFDPTPQDSFYRGKAVKLLVGFERGVAYDLYARLVARHLGRFIPGNPTFTVENHQEVGTKTAERIYRTSADGATLAALVPGLYLQQLLGTVGDKFDWGRFTWIGSPTDSPYLLYMRTDAPFKTIGDLRRSSTPAVCGTGAEMTTGFYIPRLLEETLGAKFKIVTGFKRGPDVDFAVERGELQCRALTVDGFFSHEPYPTWLRTGFVRVMLQTGRRRDPRLPEVPTLDELMDEHRTPQSDRRLAKLVLASSNFGRPIVGPPGIPPDRVGILRRAFDRAMRDPDLLAEAKKENLGLNPTDGQAMENLAREVVTQPREVIEKMKKLLSPSALIGYGWSGGPFRSEG